MVKLLVLKLYKLVFEKFVYLHTIQDLMGLEISMSNLTFISFYRGFPSPSILFCSH